MRLWNNPKKLKCALIVFDLLPYTDVPFKCEQTVHISPYFAFKKMNITRIYNKLMDLSAISITGFLVLTKI